MANDHGAGIRFVVSSGSELLWNLAGTTGLEPATSAVTVLPFEVFQRLTNPWGTPKTTEVVEDRAFCGSDCGSKLKETWAEILFTDE